MNFDYHQEMISKFLRMITAVILFSTPLVIAGICILTIHPTASEVFNLVCTNPVEFSFAALISTAFFGFGYYFWLLANAKVPQSVERLFNEVFTGAAILTTTEFWLGLFFIIIGLKTLLKVTTKQAFLIAIGSLILAPLASAYFKKRKSN